MPVIVVGTEKNFAELAPRLLRGEVTTDASRDVADAMAAANPHVDLEALTPGTVLTVPDVPHVSAAGEVSLDAASTQVIAAVIDSGEATLGALTAAAARLDLEAAAERKQLTRTLAAKELDTAARQDPALGAGLGAARQHLAEEDAGARARAAALQRVQAEWRGELQAVRKLLLP
jgi:hypothetical protein